MGIRVQANASLNQGGSNPIKVDHTTLGHLAALADGGRYRDFGLRFATSRLDACTTTCGAAIMAAPPSHRVNALGRPEASADWNARGPWPPGARSRGSAGEPGGPFFQVLRCQRSEGRGLASANGEQVGECE